MKAKFLDSGSPARTERQPDMNVILAGYVRAGVRNDKLAKIQLIPYKSYSSAMLFHFSIFFWSVAFFGALYGIASNTDLPFWTGYLYSVAALAVISIVSARRITRRIRNSVIPILIALSAPALVSLITQLPHKFAFSIIAAGMYYLAFLGLYRLRFAPSDRTARAFLSIATLSAAFFFYASVFGFYLNFNMPLSMFMLLYFFGTLGIAYQSLYPSLRNDRRKVFFYSLVIALGMSEIAWTLSFWPFSYLTIGSASLVFFFMLWDMANAHFLGDLSRKRTLLYLFLSLVLIGILIGTSPWRIQI